MALHNWSACKTVREEIDILRRAPERKTTGAVMCVYEAVLVEIEKVSIEVNVDRVLVE